MCYANTLHTIKYGQLNITDSCVIVVFLPSPTCYNQEKILQGILQNVFVNINNELPILFIIKNTDGLLVKYDDNNICQNIIDFCRNQNEEYWDINLTNTYTIELVSIG